MRKVLFLALRNTMRNRRRSLVTLAGITLGVAAAIFAQGFVAGIMGMIGSVMVDGRVGAVQVHKKGHLQADQDALNFAMAYDPALVQRIKAIKGVRAVSPRLTFEAMIGNGAQSTQANVTAIDMATETLVCINRFANVTGAPLAATSVAEGVLGTSLASGLDAKPGSTLQLLANAPGGRPNMLDVKVDGVAAPSTAFEDKRSVTVPLAYAQELLSLSGKITEYAIGVDNVETADLVARELQAQLGPEYQVVSWLDLLPQLRSIFGVFNGVLRLNIGVLMLLLLTGVANTMVMSLHERVREFGTMLALGVRREKILRMVLAESTFLGLFGAMAGGTLGLLATWLVDHNGLRIKAPGGEIPVVLHPHIGPVAVAVTLSIVVVVTLIAAVGPAWRASRLSPVEALRSV
ncbi:MAG: ABC transporter permease [Deltaproteobacteria bacterium]|nr:ABC transporter permease [Deltaproteobacteria bacterium]